MRSARSVPALIAFAVLPASAAAAGPIAKGPWITRVTPTSAVVDVELSPPGPLSIELDGPRRVVESREPKSLHAVTLDGLTPKTRYTYVVRSGAAERIGTFSTPPRDDDAADFHFLVYGDNRTDDAAHASVVRAMTAAPSEFLVHTGDLVGNGGKPEHWQTFFDIEAPLLGSRPFFSAVGNHELVDKSGVAYATYFAERVPPRAEELARTVRWGSARFFFLNGMVSFTSSFQRSWLEKALSEADAEPGLRWRIVVAHHGPWSSGPHGGNDRMLEGKVPELMRAHHVDIVFSGHDHLYERGVGDGLPFVVSGGGGAPVYEIKQRVSQSRRAESVRHFVDVAVSDASLRLTATRVDGTIIERCGLSKVAGAGADWDCDPAPSPAAPSAGGPRACGCRAVGAWSATSPAAGAFGVLAILGALAVRRRRTLS